MSSWVIIFLLLFAIWLLPIVCDLSNSQSGNQIAVTGQSSLLLANDKTKDNVELAVGVDDDGEVYLFDLKLRKLRWSFATDAPIHKSFHAEDVYMDLGDDWQLYFYRKNLQIKKVGASVDDLLKQSPLTMNGGTILGTQKTTVFVVDAETGNVVKTIRPQEDDDKALVVANDLVESPGTDLSDQKRVVFFRTDYEFTHYSSNFSVLWSVTFADIQAEFQCPTSNSLNEVSGKPFDDIEPPFPCQLRAVVPRIRGRKLQEFDGVLSILTSNLNLRPPNLNSAESGRIPLALPFPDVESPKRSAFVWSLSWPFIIAFIVATTSFVFFKKPAKLNKQAETKAIVQKKKKNRKSGNGKNSSISEKNQKVWSQEDKENDMPDFQLYERKSLLSISDHVDESSAGRRIGKLLVSSREIARGSNGTIVLEGVYEGRSVAVKRLVQTHHDVALKEIQHLIASDQHPNIVRWYGVEYDRDFVYLALERCSCSLNDLIYVYSGDFQSQMTNKDQGSKLLDDYTARLHSIMNSDKSVELWKPNGYPSPHLLKLMRDVVSGLAHLHELGIIHRDLKPQNVLIVKERPLCAKLSDMGISKRLLDNMSSLTNNITGYGSSGWQAPEQLLNQRQTRAVDLFSLGCLLFFCVTGGKHPYGDNIERDMNILRDQKDLFLVESMPEAVDLFSWLLDPNPDMRLKAQDALCHPFFWSSETRLGFFRDASDRVELEDRESRSEILNALESIAPMALNGKWDEKMESVFIDNIGRYRRYKYDSVRDLLRVIRNKLNHYRELPHEIQGLLGPVPEGFDHYFASRFPNLLIEVYKVLYKYCKDEKFFCKYLESNII